ncbi:uncharacterized protein [Watersipora subatra]|uniref:uncharacterized protein n=1 Tax=Watersipora subatra TaxID=2589382 RepID=UPI00355C6C28
MTSSTGLYLVLLWSALLSTAWGLDADIDTNRQLNSSVCIARRFCTPAAAADALMNQLSLTAAEAEEVTNYTHNTSGIVWRSCSCDENCVFRDNCCLDAYMGLLPNVGETLKEVPSVCAYYDWNVVSVIDMCPEKLPAMVGEEVRTWCEQGVQSELVRMTSSVTYVTYSNVYCAMCHGEATPKLLPWSFKFKCIDSKSLPSGNSDNSTSSNIAENELCPVDLTAPQVPPKEAAEMISTVYGALLSSGSSQNTVCHKFDRIIDTCPPGTEMALNLSCTGTVASYVTTDADPQVVYRNAHCAVCNGLGKDDLVCQPCTGTGCRKGTETTENDFLPRFSILVQPYPSENGVVCQAEGDGRDCNKGLGQLPNCNIGEYLDTTTSTCRPLCPLSTILFKGLCVMKDELSTTMCDESLSYDDYLKRGKESPYVTAEYNNNGFFLELSNGEVICHTCTRTVATRHEEDLTTLSDGSIKLNTSVIDRLFVVYEDDYTYLCLPSTPPAGTTTSKVPQFQSYQDILTFIFCIISIIFLIAFFVVFFLVKRMRNIPGSTIAGNMLMFLLAYITFVARGLIVYFDDATFCYVIAVLVNYFFISAFIFMIIYAVLIIRSLEFVDLDSRYTAFTVAQIWLGGILAPILLVIMPALLVDNLTPESIWAPAYGGESCWMESRYGNIIFFLIPVAICLIVTVIIYIVVVRRLMQIAASTSRVRDSHKEKVYLCLKLIVVLGFNWITAIIAGVVDREKYPVAAEVTSTIFIIFCCLHGFFGFIVFVASGSNIQLLKARYSKLSDSNSSSGGRATRTYSGQPPSTTAASELSTMIKQTSPKQSPNSIEKLNADVKAVADEYSPPNETLSISAEDKRNDSPISNRSNRSVHSKKTCDFF